MTLDDLERPKCTLAEIRFFTEPTIQVCFSHRLEYFENNFTAEVNSLRYLIRFTLTPDNTYVAAIVVVIKVKIKNNTLKKYTKLSIKESIIPLSTTL